MTLRSSRGGKARVWELLSNFNKMSTAFLNKFGCRAMLQVGRIRSCSNQAVTSIYTARTWSGELGANPTLPPRLPVIDQWRLPKQQRSNRAIVPQASLHGHNGYPAEHKVLMFERVKCRQSAVGLDMHITPTNNAAQIDMVMHELARYWPIRRSCLLHDESLNV